MPPLQFDPESWASSPDLQARVTASLAADDFESALTAAFNLPGPPDPYVYRAIAAVTLPQAQRAVSLGRANGLHRWYLKEGGSSGADADADANANANAPAGPAVAGMDANDAGNPTPADVDAYTAVFAASGTPAKALTALGSNARKGSLRAAVAAHLAEKRWLDVEGGLDGVAPGRWKAGSGGGSGGGGSSSNKKKKKKKKKPKGKDANGSEVTATAAATTGQQQQQGKEEKAEKEEPRAKAAIPTENAQQLVSAPQQQQHFNPALEFWAWSCRTLEWGGPCAASTRSHIAHPTLPLFMHHFGCVAPSWEALEVIRLVVERRRKRRRRLLSRQRQRTGGAGGEDDSDDSGDGSGDDDDDNEDSAPAVLDVGSGNGYWTWLLRRHGLRVCAVDSGQSVFRANWIGDTERDDGARWLRRRGGAPGDVLLLVYPVVGADFTRSMLREYRGADIVVAGTQNSNGYTGFVDMTMEQFMQKEKPEWKKTAQIPLPSFAGKDEALFVFRAD